MHVHQVRPALSWQLVCLDFGDDQTDEGFPVLLSDPIVTGVGVNPGVPKLLSKMTTHIQYDYCTLLTMSFPL